MGHVYLEEVVEGKTKGELPPLSTTTGGTRQPVRATAMSERTTSRGSKEV